MRRDWTDLLGGGAMVALGLAVAAYSAAHYDTGTLRRIGPGFLPLGLGVMLAIFGAIIALPAWSRPGQAVAVAWREALCVLASILIFGLGMARLGLVPATMLAVLVASVPAPQDGIAWRVVLAAVVSLLTWLVFSVGLRLSIPVWPA